MSSAESSYQQSFLQRVSNPLFLVLSLLLVFAGTSVSVFAAMIVCVIAGVENSDLQARIGLAATLVGFVGTIYLLIRARRSSPSQHQQSRRNTVCQRVRSSPTSRSRKRAISTSSVFRSCNAGPTFTRGMALRPGVWAAEARTYGHPRPRSDRPDCRPPSWSRASA
jgi:hypothetical protein